MFGYFKKNKIYLLALLASLLSFWSAFVYRLYSLNYIGIIISLILTIFSFIILLFYFAGKKKQQKSRFYFSSIFNFSFSIFHFFLFTLYFFLFFILFHSTTANSIISPWQVIPSYFFFFYILTTVLLIIIISKASKTGGLIKFFLFLHYFLSFSVCLIIYKIGYGFDFFVHQATVGLIDKIGSVDPKPFYYLGQYGLITILHKITFIPIFWLNKIMVPFLAALFLPNALLEFLNRYFKNQKTNLFLAVFILILPFSFFIATTPQNLSYLFFILSILYGLSSKEIGSIILALASLSFHPIAGLPAVFFVLVLIIHKNFKKSTKKYLYPLLFVLSGLSLPFAFYFLNNGKLNLDLNVFANVLAGLTAPSQENFILNYLYLYIFNLKIIISALALAGIFLFWQKRQRMKALFLNLLMAFSLFASYFLVKQISFDFLIDYEKGDYSQRILFVALIFLFPFIVLSLEWLVRKILEQQVAIKIPCLIFLVLAVCASFYASYPRLDPYYNSHGYSVSQKDLEAVQWIEKDAKNENYIVLANQQVSAAALHKFGFQKYFSIPDKFEEKIFYYPIPTSSPLYDFYLKMVYDKPSRDNMVKAMDLANVNQSYFVLNKYWWAFPKILAEAKWEADAWLKIANGEIYVFKYIK